MKLLPYRNKYFVAVLVFLIVPLSGVSIDIYVPSLPAVSHYFHVTKRLSQLSVTAYLIGLGIMHLFAGSFSDSFGRKKPFMIAMVVYIITTFFITCSQEIYQLIFLRFIQGASLAMAVVPMRSVISDLFEGKELRKMMVYMTMAWSIGPIIAPAIGGYLQYYCGWKADFYFLDIYSLIIFICATMFLFETSNQQHPFQLLNILRRYRQMFAHQEYLNSITIGGLIFSLITLFGIVGPFFIQTVLHYTPAQYGRLTLFMGLAWFLGSMMNRLVLHLSLTAKAKTGFSLMLITVFLMLSIAIFYPIKIYNIVIPMFFLYFFSGVLYPSYFIHSVLLFREMSASANAFYNFSAFFISGIISILGTFIRLNTEVPFIGVLIVLVGLCLVICWRSAKNNPNPVYSY